MNTTQDITKWRFLTAPRVLFYGIALVSALWLAYMAYFRAFEKHPIEKWGQFGDAFGALNCLFTGFALVGVVAAFWHEREQTSDRENEHREQLARMQAQTDATLRVLQFEAKRFRYERVEDKLKEAQKGLYDVEIRKDLYGATAEIAAELARVRQEETSLAKEYHDLQAWFDDASRIKI